MNHSYYYRIALLLAFLQQQSTKVKAASSSWKDASQIVNDLSQYSALYITYHSCAMSQYGSGEHESGDNNNGEAQCAYDNNVDEEGTMWYMGNTYCVRANVAFSLYGTAAGKEGGCSRGTYINSFFTTGGVQAFVQAVSNNGINAVSSSTSSVTSECQVTSNDNYYEYYESYGNGEKIDPYATSIGLTCHGGNFRQSKFQSATCSLGSEQRVIDRLRSFNNDISDMKCIQIYDASTGMDTASNLLSSSTACTSTVDDCPDPHGKLRKYTKNLWMSTVEKRSPVRTFFYRIFSWTLLASGVLLCALSIEIMRRKGIAKSKSKKQRTINSKFLKRLMIRRKGRGRDQTVDDGVMQDKSSSRRRSRSKSASKRLNQTM